MGDREGRHCSWIRCRWMHDHEWERLRGLGGKTKMELKKKEFLLRKWRRTGIRGTLRVFEGCLKR